MTDIEVTPYTYRVSPFGPNTGVGQVWVCWIRMTDTGKWVVMRYHHHHMFVSQYLDIDGNWTTSTGPEVRHSFEEAKLLAREAIPKITVGGLSYADAKERFNVMA